MQLTFIVPIYREVTNWATFFAMFEAQTLLDFELILVIDTHSGLALAEINAQQARASAFWHDRLKLIFNTRRVGRTSAIKLGINEAAGAYSLIFSTSDTIEASFVAKLASVLDKYQPDIIEFGVNIRKPLRYHWLAPQDFRKPALVGENKALFALVAPFEFNKFFSTSVLKKAARLKLNAVTDSRYSLEHTYTALTLAESYLALPEELITSHAAISLNFDPLKLLKQWKALLTFFDENLSGDFYNEWAYAFTRAQVEFIAKVVDKETKRAFRHRYAAALGKELKALDISDNFYFSDKPKLLSAIGKF